LVVIEKSKKNSYLIIMIPFNLFKFASLQMQVKTTLNNFS